MDSISYMRFYLSSPLGLLALFISISPITAHIPIAHYTAKCSFNSMRAPLQICSHFVLKNKMQKYVKSKSFLCHKAITFALPSQSLIPKHFCLIYTAASCNPQAIIPYALQSAIFYSYPRFCLGLL